MRVLVTGASGLLGSSLCLALAQSGHDVTGTYLTHAGPFPFSAFRIDLRDEPAVTELFSRLRPEFVVHCAALSKVIECERQPELAWQQNVHATRRLAILTESFDAHFVFLSTDQVFDGETGNHSEDDSPAPTHVYGRSKAEGEQIVRDVCSSYLILRSNNIVGHNLGFGQSFTDNILRKLCGGERVELFQDQLRSPIHLSVMTSLIVNTLQDRLTGVLHAGGAEQLSRYETGCRLATAYKISLDKLIPVSLKSHPEAAYLQRNGTFGTSKMQSLYPALGRSHILQGFQSDAVRFELADHV